MRTSDLLEKERNAPVVEWQVGGEKRIEVVDREDAHSALEGGH